MYYAVKINGKEDTDFRSGKYPDLEAKDIIDEYRVRIRNSFEYWEEVNNFYTSDSYEGITVDEAMVLVESDLEIFIRDALEDWDTEEVFMGGISFVFDDSRYYENVEDTREPLRDYENMGCWGE